MIISEAFEIAEELLIVLTPYLHTTEFLALCIAISAYMFIISYVFGCLFSYGFGFAKFVFETLVRLIKGVIQNDR